MASFTVLGLFDQVDNARAARQDLIQAGIPESSIQIKNESAGGTTTGHGSSTTSRGEDKGFWESVKELFGGDPDYDRDATYYAEGARRGGYLLTANVEENHIDQVTTVLESHHAVDIEDRAAQWQREGWQGYQADATTPTAGSTATAGNAATAAAARTASAATTRDTSAAAATNVEGKMAVPVVQEELAVGKRQVQRGGIRVVRRVTETPVEENVTLREEHVNVDRRPVNRDLTGRDLNDAFSDKVVEVRESAEEAVTSKNAKVVEEVVVDKDVRERNEKVRDTVRRSDVQVERLPGQETTERTEKVVDDSTATRSDRTKTGA